jgi:hypothetical protein
MAYIDESNLARSISKTLSLPIVAQQLGRSQTVEVRLQGLERPNAFSIAVTAGLQLVFAELKWDRIAQPMLSSIARADQNAWLHFSSLRSSLKESNISSLVRMNGEELDFSLERPTQLRSFELRTSTVDWRGTTTESAAEVAIASLSLIVGLLPLDVEVTSAHGGWEPEEEGLQIDGAITRYERSRSNRAVAILLHGTRCVVCRMDFGERYPEIGSGYVEIHHLTPLHVMLHADIVNPATDLVPLCSNCHRMAHRADPPYTPESLRAILSEER